jgi:hypothetical protein
MRVRHWFGADHPYAKCLDQTSDLHGENAYPGSPLIATQILRDTDTVTLAELHTSEHNALELSLRAMTGMVKDLVPNERRLAEAAGAAFSTATEQLAGQASYISYGPTRVSSSALVGAFDGKPDLKMAPQMPTAPDNFKNALQNDFEFWADNQDELNERFNAWLAN